jgi:hypothetical protein
MSSYLPSKVGEMNRLERDYREVGLPGAHGSVDVVHINIKWVMILPVLTVSTLPYQVYGQTDVRTTEFLTVIDPR